MIPHCFGGKQVHSFSKSQVVTRARNQWNHNVCKRTSQKGWILGSTFTQIDPKCIFGARNRGVHVAGMRAYISHLLQRFQGGGKKPGLRHIHTKLTCRKMNTAASCFPQPRSERFLPPKTWRWEAVPNDHEILKCIPPVSTVPHEKAEENCSAKRFVSSE